MGGTLDPNKGSEKAPVVLTPVQGETQDVLTLVLTWSGGLSGINTALLAPCD